MIRALTQPVDLQRIRTALWAMWNAEILMPASRLLPHWLFEVCTIVDIEIQASTHLITVVRDGKQVSRIVAAADMVEGALAPFVDQRSATPASANRGDTIICRLPVDAYITKQIRLPESASYNLRSALELQIDVETPFSAPDVYYAARISKRIAAHQQIIVDMAVSPRSTMDALLQPLTSIGIQPQIVTIHDDVVAHPTFNFLHQPKVKPFSWKGMTAFGLSFLLCCQLAIAAYFPIHIRQEFATELEMKAERSMAVAASLNRQYEDFQKSRNKDHYALQQRQTYLALLQALKSLTVAIPDDAWLNHLTYRPDRIEIAGSSPATSKLLDLVTAKELFTQASYVSPIIRDQQLNLDRFSLSFKLDAAAEPRD